MVENGADLIINIAASPFHAGKIEFKRDMLGNISKKYKVTLVYVNQVGGNDGVLFDGMSMAFDSRGIMTAQASDFEEEIIVFDTESESRDIRPISETDTDSILKALVIGTRDYVQKCGFSKVAVGLSGGLIPLLLRLSPCGLLVRKM